MMVGKIVFFEMTQKSYAEKIIFFLRYKYVDVRLGIKIQQHFQISFEKFVNINEKGLISHVWKIFSDVFVQSLTTRYFSYLPFYTLFILFLLKKSNETRFIISLKNIFFHLIIVHITYTHSLTPLFSYKYRKYEVENFPKFTMRFHYLNYNK